MDTGVPPTDDHEGIPAAARWAVALRGTRAHARVYGSVLGPSILVPGHEDEPWQVLLLGVDSPPPSAIVRAIFCPPNQQAGFGLEDPTALALGRGEAGCAMVVPTGPTTFLPWMWTRHTGDGREADHLDAMVDEVAALSGEVDTADVRAVLLADRMHGDPLRELVTLLGLPMTVVDVLDVPEADVSRLGEPLFPADGRRHIKALVEATSATHDSMWAEIVAEIESSSRRNPIDAFFGVVWMSLGTALGLLGVLGLVRGASPGATVLGVESPWAWIGMAAVLVWFGLRQWRGARATPPG